MPPSECPPIVVSLHPMLVKLEQLSQDPKTRQSVIDGIAAGGSSGERLTRIQSDGLTDVYPTQGAKDKARRQLLDGLWGNEDTLLKISAGVMKAFEAVTSTKKRLVARWLPGVTGQEILPIVAEGTEAIYLLLLTRSLETQVVMDKAAYDPELLAHLREQAADVVAFLEGP
jgi:hypothetical protein